ncbi:LamG domain-containing protein [Planctomycetota bacterium]
MDRFCHRTWRKHFLWGTVTLMLMSHGSAWGEACGKIPEANLVKQLGSSVLLKYSFDRDAGTRVIDVSGAGFHGRLEDAEYTAAGFHGQGLRLFGYGDHVAVSDVKLRQFTLSAWVRSDTDDIDNRVLFFLKGGRRHFAVQGNSAGGIGVVVTGGAEVNEYEWLFEPGSWIHLTVTYDGFRVCIYRDGVLTETRSLRSYTPINGRFTLGAADSKQKVRSWRGVMDDVVVFNRMLGCNEVLALYGAAVKDAKPGTRPAKPGKLCPKPAEPCNKPAAPCTQKKSTDSSQLACVAQKPQSSCVKLCTPYAKSSKPCVKQAEECKKPVVVCNQTKPTDCSKTVCTVKTKPQRCSIQPNAGCAKSGTSCAKPVDCPKALCAGEKKLWNCGINPCFCCIPNGKPCPKKSKTCPKTVCITRKPLQIKEMVPVVPYDMGAKPIPVAAPQVVARRVNPTSDVMIIEALVDDFSDLWLRHNGILWKNVTAFAKPGQVEGRDEPTWVNGTAWYPTWDGSEERGIDLTEVWRRPMRPGTYQAELLAVGESRSADTIERGSIETVSLPGSFIIRFIDQNKGPRWFRVRVSRVNKPVIW